ncbi:AMP-dependent synthetase/ligase [Fusarium oxysporum f. sp. vasinfectum]|nr:AMP-dependent synthetase/ligase [Fusarium oxysporum f. sp. vasinfectum]KAK2932007.1 AMP-dependent synthetase/ligase [Fusarium oxysporum f. sp. vasinfectum]
METTPRESKQIDLWISEFITFGAATVFIGLRLLSRRLTRIEFWWDDWFAIGCYAVAIAWVVIIPIWIKDAGLGLHINDIHGRGTKAEILMHNSLILYVAELFYATALFCAKGSILSFYWRMFRVTNIKLPIQILACCSLIWIIIRTFMGIFHCIPVQRFWDPSAGGSCAIEDKKFFFGTILVHVMLDIAIIALPILQIRKLQLPFFQKVGIMLMFVFGIVICASAMVIIVASTQFDATSEDLTWNLVTIVVWASVEVNLVTVSTCLPTVRPAILYLFTCTNPTSTIGSGSNSYGPSYGRSQTKNTIRLSTLPNNKDNDESSSTHQLADSDQGGRGSLSDFESHAMDRYRGNVSTVTGRAHDHGSEEFNTGSPFGGIMVKNETTYKDRPPGPLTEMRIQNNTTTQFHIHRIHENGLHTSIVGAKAPNCSSRLHLASRLHDKRDLWPTPNRQIKKPIYLRYYGKDISVSEAHQRADFLACALAKRLDFSPNEGVEWDKVVSIFSVNTIDSFTVTQAIHRLNGIITPASAASDLEHQLRSSGVKALFTCASRLDIAVKAAKTVGIPQDRIFILATPDDNSKLPFTTFDDLVKEGADLPKLEPLKWVKGQGARQVAFLCYSSGTSGLPKAVMISHRNVIANVLQLTTYESVSRKKDGIETQACLGALPFSHIYGLLIISFASTFRGDEVVVLPEFDLEKALVAVQTYKIAHMFVVPPIIIRIIHNQALCAKYDLSSVRWLYTGAAPLGSEVVEEVKRQYPKWRVGQGYGLTETCTVVCTTSEDDIDIGSSGSLVPATKAIIIDIETGEEITEYNKPGELLVQTPSLVLGYMNNERATSETFIWRKDDRWIRTGDEVLIRLAPSGNEHLVVVDRLKELIKVNGHQVAPAELEAHLLSHPYVSDCAVIQTPNDKTGEVPKAYIVKSDACGGQPDEALARAICKHVEDHKQRYKWLGGGVEFIETIPKSPSGKILRRLLRDKEKEARNSLVSKL